MFNIITQRSWLSCITAAVIWFACIAITLIISLIIGESETLWKTSLIIAIISAMSSFIIVYALHTYVMQALNWLIDTLDNAHADSIFKHGSKNI